MTDHAPPSERWRSVIHELASFSRPSASDGERHAAELVARHLRELGCRVRVEEEEVHGGYWWPVVTANLLAAAGAAAHLGRPGRASRLAALALGASAAAALWDDLGHGRRWFRRALFPRRSTWNAVGELGDPQAERTLVLIAHHDAAHSGLVFHPAIGRLGPRLFPAQHARATQDPPILYLVWLGPVGVALGGLLGRCGLSRGAGALALGATAAMLDVWRSEVVPGANDNLSAVGALVAVAEALEGRAPEGLRLVLLSTGSEESFSEGMQAFGERHFGELDPARTEFLCLECLGGPELIVLEGEGMLRMRMYPQRMREALAQAAAAAGVPITRGLRTVAATDGIIPLRAGYPTVTLASIDENKKPLNYHWPSDRPEALHWNTIEDAIATCLAFVRRGAPEPETTP